jgi:hypothetical protein
VYPILGIISDWKLGTWKGITTDNYSSCPSKVYWGESLKLPTIFILLVLSCTLFFILMPEMLKNKMKWKDTYLDNWRCSSPKLAYSRGCISPKLGFNLFCFYKFYDFFYFIATTMNIHMGCYTPQGCSYGVLRFSWCKT